jgi:hypothetical protein
MDMDLLLWVHRCMHQRIIQMESKCLRMYLYKNALMVLILRLVLLMPLFPMFVSKEVLLTTSLQTPWPDSISRPVCSEVEMIPLDHAARASEVILQFCLKNLPVNHICGHIC